MDESTNTKNKWQPMETAPRDGTWILGYYNRGNWICGGEKHGKHNYLVISWRKDPRLEVSNSRPWEDFGPGLYAEEDIAAWMPLPNLPNQEEFIKPGDESYQLIDEGSNV